MSLAPHTRAGGCVAQDAPAGRQPLRRQRQAMTHHLRTSPPGRRRAGDPPGRRPMSFTSPLPPPALWPSLTSRRRCANAMAAPYPSRRARGPIRWLSHCPLSRHSVCIVSNCPNFCCPNCACFSQVNAATNKTKEDEDFSDAQIVPKLTRFQPIFVITSPFCIV